MKKAVKTITIMVTTILMVILTTTPTMAAGMNFSGNMDSSFDSFFTDEDLQFINEAPQMFEEILEENTTPSTEPEQEDAQSQIEETFRQHQTEWVNTRDEIQKKAAEIKQTSDEIQSEWEEDIEEADKAQDSVEIVGILLLILAILLLVAEIGYIFVTAPKCGMTRFWALVPLFSNLFGLIVFIVVRSNHKSATNNHTFTCPTCNSVHPVGTSECSICGTKF